jgi:hypothetical protein
MASSVFHSRSRDPLEPPKSASVLTSSFFLVSTLITGSLSAWNRPTCVLIEQELRITIRMLFAFNGFHVGCHAG